MYTFRRHRYSLLAVILIILIFWYMTTAKDSTQNSAFYKKTAAAIERRRNEGPQAPGSAHKTFLKGGSIRPSDPKPPPIDTDPIDETDNDLLEQIDAQMSKEQDLTAEVEGLDRGLEDADANARAGRTAEDIELERQIVRARKREQEKLKEELRQQLKHKELQRQKFLSTKVMNPTWVGAFEKERKPPAKTGKDLELAPDSDPFRDKPTGDASNPSTSVGEKSDLELAPNADPFRDKTADEPYKAPVPVGQGIGEDAALLEQKSEQQQDKLVKEQEFLDPIEPATIKQRPVGETSSHPTPIGLDTEELEFDGPIHTRPGRKESLSDSERIPIREVERLLDTKTDAVLDSKHSPNNVDPTIRKQILKGSGAIATEDDEEPNLETQAYKIKSHGSEDEDAMLSALGTTSDELDEIVPFRGHNAAPAAQQAVVKPAKVVQEANGVARPATSAEDRPRTPPPAHKTPGQLELSRLLALSPITIFSKTHCPYSKKAKRILTEVFEINPTPYVVELDTHEHGPELQKLLQERTGRGTVPNIMINGVSLGGGDEVEMFWESGELRDVIREMGGKRVLSVIEKEPR